MFPFSRFFKAFAVSVGLATTTGALYAQDATTPPRVIVVQGSGQVSMAPDIATLTLGVTTQAQTAQDALTANSTRMTEVMALMTERGIAERDLQTAQFSVQPVYDRSERNETPRIAGYSARNSLLVRVRDLEGLGALLDAAVQQGSNTLSGLSFGMDDPRAARQMAEAEAVRNALSRAENMAEAAGLSLGPVLRIDTTRSSGPRPMMEMGARMASDSMAVPVAAGELDLSAQVEVTLSLQDK